MDAGEHNFLGASPATRRTPQVNGDAGQVFWFVTVCVRFDSLDLPPVFATGAQSF